MRKREVIVVTGVLIIFVLIAGLFVAYGYSKAGELFDKGILGDGASDDGVNNGEVLFSPGSLTYVGGTPDDEFAIDNGSILISGLIEQDVGEVIYEFDGVNTTFFSSDLKLMMNFGGVSGLGESSTFVNDSSGNGNGGIVMGGAGVSDGVNFDGVDDFVLVEDSVSLQIANVISIEVEVKPSVNVDGQTIVSKGDDYSLTLGGEGKIKFKVAGNEVISSGNVIENGMANRVIAVYDGSRGVIYVEGVNVGESSFSGAISTSDSNLTIGSEGSGNFFNGSVDEIMIWNKVLSAEEVEVFDRGNLQKSGVDRFELTVMEDFSEPASEENHSYNIFVRGSGGGLRELGQRKIRNVGEGPEIDFRGSSPAENGFVNDDPVVFDLEIVDKGVGLESFDLNITRTGVSLGYNFSTNGSFKTVYALPEGGVYSANVTATDSFGFVSSVVRNFVVDRTDPIVIITSPSNRTYTVDDIFLRVVMNEAGECEYDLDDQGRESFSENNGSIFNVSLDLNDDTHRIEIRCNDQAGNVNSNEFIDFIVDTPSSVSNVNSSSSSTSSSGSSSGSASGSGSGSGSSSTGSSSDSSLPERNVVEGTLSQKELSFSEKSRGFVKDHWIIILLGFGILLLVIVISLVFIKLKKKPENVVVSPGQGNQEWMPKSHNSIPTGILQNNSVSKQGFVPNNNSFPSASSLVGGIGNKIEVKKALPKRVIREVKNLKGFEEGENKNVSDDFSDAERKIIIMGAKEFVKEAKKRDYSNKEIREKLKNKGWEEDELDDLF